MGSSHLPGVDGDDNGRDRIVFHVDMDCFYASCERLREPELRGAPVVVGMGYEAGESHGAVATASYEAREHGIESAQPIGQALDALPRIGSTPPDHDGPVGHYRPVDLDFYKDVAGSVKSILHECAETVREVSIDEAYLDVTDRTGWTKASDGRPLAEGYARYVKDRIDREVGVTASIGVAPDMATAKIASDYDKPDGLTVVAPGTVRSFLEPIPIDELHGVGPVTADELRSMGIETAGDLATADRDTLVERFGSRGGELYDRARGEDDRAVTPTGDPKSLSRESAFTQATEEAEAIKSKVKALAADVAERARERGALYRTIGIKVVRPPFDVNTRAQSLSGPVDAPDLVEKVALDLCAEFEGDRVRKLGVRVSNLDFDGSDQATLTGYETTTDERDRPTQNGQPDRPEGERIVDWIDTDERPIDDTRSTAEGRPTGQRSLSEFADSDR
ncbi:DNA polymerase IV [Halalkalirubrum salinum]|uniref:DNA polymerase IV n=1 Tax=Halalkalirubrum salinum TaxID=2563889 RepID=UPI0010FACF62|nr:DNA polymerase IV [Halalkalirubrum salinum]